MAWTNGNMTRAMIVQQMVTIITQTRTAKCKVHAMIARSITDWINRDLTTYSQRQSYIQNKKVGDNYVFID